MDINRSSIGAEPLLDRGEEIALARRIEAGVLAREARLAGRQPGAATVEELLLLEAEGEQARQRFIRANLRLVAMVAGREAARTGLSEPELFQEGCVALVVAVLRFDHTRGCRFATYALLWIRAYVNAATANRCGELNLPASRAAALRQVRGAHAELSQSLGRAPTPAQLATFLGRNVDWVTGLLAYETPQLIGHATIADLERADGQGDDPYEEVLGFEMPGQELLRHLARPERAVIEARFGFLDGLQRSYAETARVLQVSVTQVRRRERRALETLRRVCPQGAAAHL
ncbi:sigma-70 family RNA polymerase sigma factor [Microlunatus panaciterrae]|uniref:RNA polymerase sigma factor (Sigma-70 family) n=1 Tax=Microlunatus panaciterrae TaxID=400768 RepID=A0ABS2RG77_9ACTN|nr:sigma-70 family RNA polymerase sigma factor [Microlunatus panaciterrae]MBM7797753.1 RNA polymerase sigma factor (sigma-70 family) [Microlunatus panaciterrae]